jgi:hypothetical protein
MTNATTSEPVARGGQDRDLFLVVGEVAIGPVMETLPTRDTPVILDGFDFKVTDTTKPPWVVLRHGFIVPDHHDTEDARFRCVVSPR